MAVYLALVGATFGLFKAVPGVFVPGQDKTYLVAFAQLPDAATLDRTENVIRRMGEIAMAHPGVENAVAFPGLSISGFTNASNAGIVFVMLKPFAERKSPELSANALALQLNQKFAGIQEAFVAIFPPEFGEELARLEHAYAGRGEDEIEQTKFEAVRMFDGYRARVVSQTPKR